MLKNYFKTAFRNLLREKGISIINLSGLTLGITCSLILFLMVSYMSSFDADQRNRNRIYRIVNQSQGNSGTEYQSGVPTVLPDAFRLDFPEAEQVVFTSYHDDALIVIPQASGELKKYQEDRGIVFTEPSFFKIFDRDVLIGDAEKGLDEPNEAMISRSWALKYFGREDAVGEVLKFGQTEYTITGILSDIPSNTDLPFNLMLSYVTIKKEHEERGWNSISSNEHCYFLMKESEPVSKVESRLKDFSIKYLGKDDPDKTEFIVQAFTDMHFDDRFDVYSYDNVSKGTLIAFSVIGIILIITACINFINLATADAIKRSKEVGIRKSLGSTRSQLIGQFIGETTLVTLIAVLVSLATTQLVLGFINSFMEMDLSLDFSGNPNLWIYLVSVTALVSVLSGLYPAFVMSGFKPSQALKNLMDNRNSSGYFLRRTLVVFQFVISQLFIIGTIVVINQMHFYQHQDLGFSKEGILVTSIPDNTDAALRATKMRTLRDELLQVSGVAAVSLSHTPPSADHVSGTNFIVKETGGDHGTQVKQIDGNYVSLFDLDLIAGQNVQDLDTATGFIVNETLTKVAGFSKPEDMLGKVIRVWRRELPVVGIVKDFHTVSLHDPIEATVMFNRISGYRTLALKVDMNKAQEVIAELKTKWEASYPEDLFEYQFLDESIRQFYDGERKMSTLISVFTSMAIFIGCLGLFGLATFMANQKTKEIGVRKVLGASVESIIMMFSREYLKLIVLGFVIASPLAWFVMTQFLDEFAYKITMGPGIFILAFGTTILIAMLTVG
ncbi:MAG TPA: FtsX-like permease family protein, partial [Ohtaekwangia sp.]